MKTCTDCPANRISNERPHGFCPLGYKQKLESRIKMPAEDCPKPASHAEVIAILEGEIE